MGQKLLSDVGVLRWCECFQKEQSSKTWLRFRTILIRRESCVLSAFFKIKWSPFPSQMICAQRALAAKLIPRQTSSGGKVPSLFSKIIRMTCSGLREIQLLASQTICTQSVKLKSARLLSSILKLYSRERMVD